MGKAIKAVQEALINLGVTGRKSMTWVCVQQAMTNSFREAALYYSFTSSSSSKGEELERVIISAADDDDDDEGGDQSFSSTTSMNVTSSPLWTTTESPYDDSSKITETSELATKSSISSKRFFFSPCTTKSIMGEEEEEAAAHDDDDDDDEVESRRMKMMSMMSHDGLTMAVASENPYQDFKESMEEMVRGHEIKSWNGLQELLHCYLSLNDRTNHQTILLAFVDLLINLVASRSQRTSRPCTSISPPAESGH